MTPPNSSSNSVANSSSHSSSGALDCVVVGAGLAGLAAATSLARESASVTVLDRRPTLGGRAYSYLHPALEETVDSQHVILGCCTNLVDLTEQAGAGTSVRWYDALNFLEPGRGDTPGKRTLLKPGALPAPSHQTLSFLRAPMLSVADKVGVALGLIEFLRGYPQSDSESFATWLRRTRQTDRAIRHFWEPVVLGALNDTFERCSTKYAGKIFHEAFLSSPMGGRLGIPTLPLSEWLAPVAEFARETGVDLRLKTGMTQLEPVGSLSGGAGNGARWRVTAGAETFEAANVILAMDFRQTRQLLAGLPGASQAGTGEVPGVEVPAVQVLDPFVAAPITTVHLWYSQTADELGIDLDHAVLLDTRIQWIFVKSRIRRWAPERGTYLELVISASWAELEMGREAILASALEELPLFFPGVRGVVPKKSGVLKEARATFSVTPGLDAYRPDQKTRWPGLFLAGDWTRTEWPSTMESAVRSGRLAAGALLGGADERRFLAPELAPAGLMPLLVRGSRQARGRSVSAPKG